MPDLIPFQYSIKIGDEIYMVQTMTSDELGLAIHEIRTKFIEAPVTTETSQPPDNCPKCNSSLIKTETKTGKKIKKCSTNKWNFTTKKAEGCDYILWL